MRGKYYSQEIKNKIESLRSSGKTYGQLTALYGVPKSTLSTWLGKKYPGVFDKAARLVHLERIRILSQNRLREIRLQQEKALYDKISKEFRTYPLENLGFYKSILAALYWAEGAKHERVSGIKFVNTDPKMMSLYIRLLRKCYKIDEKRFKIRVHVHYYHKHREVKELWSELLQVPQNQFWKIYHKKRSITKRFRKNFMGICFLYHSDSNIRKELLEISRSLAGMVI